MHFPRRRLLQLGGLAALAALARPANAQAFPTRTVRFIVPFGPASGTDIAARLFADRLGARWGKPAAVEHRPAAPGPVRISAFPGATHNHTLPFIPSATFLVHPHD